MNRVKPILGRVKAGYDLWADQDVEGYVEVGHGDAQNGDLLFKSNRRFYDWFTYLWGWFSICTAMQ